MHYSREQILTNVFGSAFNWHSPHRCNCWKPGRACGKNLSRGNWSPKAINSENSVVTEQYWGPRGYLRHIRGGRPSRGVVRMIRWLGCSLWPPGVQNITRSYVSEFLCIRVTYADFFRCLYVTRTFTDQRQMKNPGPTLVGYVLEIGVDSRYGGWWLWRVSSPLINLRHQIDEKLIVVK